MSDLTELFDLTNRLMTPAGERPTHKDSEVWMFIKAGLRRVTALPSTLKRVVVILQESAHQLMRLLKLL